MTAGLATVPQRGGLLVRFGDRYGVDPKQLMSTLRATAFQTDKPVTNEQLMALLIVAEQYGLNPFVRELYAFADRKGIVPVVSVDGWSRIINQRPELDGIEFVWPDDGSSTWCECVMYRKDRAHPVRVREYLEECSRGTEPWKRWPRRMLRHKALIQAARVAFSFAGICDEDEARPIIDVTPGTSAGSRAVAAINAQIIDLDTGEEQAKCEANPAARDRIDSDEIAQFATELRENAQE